MLTIARLGAVFKRGRGTVEPAAIEPRGSRFRPPCREAPSRADPSAPRHRSGDHPQEGLMTPEALVQDVRIGFRLLFKERLVSGLAVLVLAVGISAVTTQFSLINGVMLRGFSFPTADRLVDVSFVDPSTATAFGVNRQMFSMDFEEFRARAAVVRADGRSPRRIHGQHDDRRAATAVHRGIHDGGLLPDPGRSADATAATSPRPTTGQARRRWRSSATACGSASLAGRKSSGRACS